MYSSRPSPNKHDWWMLRFSQINPAMTVRIRWSARSLSVTWFLFFFRLLQISLFAGLYTLRVLCRTQKTSNVWFRYFAYRIWRCEYWTQYYAMHYTELLHCSRWEGSTRPNGRCKSSGLSFRAHTQCWTGSLASSVVMRCWWVVSDSVCYCQISAHVHLITPDGFMKAFGCCKCDHDCVIAVTYSIELRLYRRNVRPHWGAETWTYHSVGI